VVVTNIIKQSQAVQVGSHIFVSGQIPADKNGNLVEGSIADKTKASCEGMKAILEEAGSSMSKVIKVRLLL
jgi:enamine deaminase RidA (YjgF/YER057c/UK114 family)